jgi:hypothetical protein
MTTSPDGELVPVERRLAEIHRRYGPGHLVSRSIQRATPMILRPSNRSKTAPSGAHRPADRKWGQCYERPDGPLQPAEPLVPTNVPTSPARPG